MLAAVLRKVSPFWMVVVALAMATAWFVVGVERQRAALAQQGPAVEDGAVVTLDSVVDGDTVVVRTEAGERVSVRVLGIKAFDGGSGRDDATRFGREAMDAIERRAANKPIRLALSQPPRDKYGRLVASLSVDDEDLALALVRDGLVLVYTVYPFAAMGLYLQEQEAAKADRRGLWGAPQTAQRADLLLRDWRSQTP
jgi:endonuclease YncB( thermonuclease family)